MNGLTLWWPVFAIILLFTLDWLFLRKQKHHLNKWDGDLFAKSLRLKDEDGQLKLERQRLSVLQEEIDEVVCQEAHLPGDCPRCGAT